MTASKRDGAAGRDTTPRLEARKMAQHGTVADGSASARSNLNKNKSNVANADNKSASEELREQMRRR